MKLKSYLLTLIMTIFCVLQTMAAAIPAEFIGDGKWVTLKTENGYYFYAIEEDSKIKLGQTKTAPTSENYAAYCWKIEYDNETKGYSFRCLKYENDQDGKKYITNPTTLGTNSQEVLLTNTASYYNYTNNHQLQLVADNNLYLAFYSQRYNTIRLHNSADYVGSRMIIGGIYDWSVAAVVYGTETEGVNGEIPQGTYLPGGGVTYNGKTYYHGSSLRVDDISTGFEIIPIGGYIRSVIKIDEKNHYIVAYYIGDDTFNYKNAPVPSAGTNVVTGENNTVWALEAKHYITNTSGNYTTVPADKAWQMEIVVENTNTSGDDPSFNKWGSCILSSYSDPLNTFYWGDFQIYQHAPTHSSPNTLNFKSSKADGLDHIIAQGASVANKSYKVIVRYNGGNVYVIRTIMLDENLGETANVYNNVWVSGRTQNEINHMSCALPTGINIKSLRISIAEESNLLEGVDYAIQNIGTKKYLTGTTTASAFAGDAAKCQIEWTNNQDLTYAEQDGGLHNSFYVVKVATPNQYLKADNTWTAEKARAQSYIYTTSKHIAPITSKNTLGTEWTINTNNTWEFDFFANFYVEVAGNNSGGLNYQKNSEQQTATNGQYIELPSGVLVEQMSNSSQDGYMAAISKADIRLKVQYTALENTFYNITDKSNSTKTLYYWYKDRQTTPSLITYSTTNSQSGVETAWDDKGDCSKFTIEKATQIPMKMSQVGEKYYNTVYCPNALTLPEGVKAYRLNEVADSKFKLKEIELTDNVLPAKTAAVLISESAVDATEWAISTTSPAAIEGTNLFSGVFEQTTNPGSGKGTSSNVFVLGNKSGIGFYPYTAAMIPAFKVYYEEDQAAAPAKGYLFSFEDDEETTGIRDAADASQSGKIVVYDLMGRRVQTLNPGHIYIINGKKFVAP